MAGSADEGERKASEMTVVKPHTTSENKEYGSLPSPETEEPMSGRRKRVLFMACVCILGK